MDVATSTAQCATHRMMISFNKEILIGNYERHNRDVVEYFKGSDTLFIGNVSEAFSYRRFCKFIRADPLND
jgi:hypothetical protein